MKKILIISPHYPPSNLAAVHRSRLFAQHLPTFGWNPIVLTVHEKFYEEELDLKLCHLLPAGQQIIKVSSFPVTKPRVIGDIGLRAFFQLRKKALALVRKEAIDFVYIPIPSFYAALIGPWLHRKTGVKYGIDYIDPWVHQFPGSEKVFSRHWWSTELSRFLEPIAVKKASLVTGVAEGYYAGVKERNPWLAKSCIFGAMPYGGEAEDHRKVKGLEGGPYLFQKKPGKLQMVYAGALLPKARGPLEGLMKAIAQNASLFSDVEFHFIGTGKTPNDKESYNIRPMAERWGLWNTIVFEYPARIPYLDVLVHLESSSGVFILGSTEPHYTPSKVYQAVLSGKPIFALLHKESSAYDLLKTTGAGIVIGITENGERTEKDFLCAFDQFRTFCQHFSPGELDSKAFQAFSAREVTKKLASLLDEATGKTISTS